MDWGGIIAGAIGGGAAGAVSFADQADKERRNEELATLKGNMQMDRLLASVEAKYNQAIAVQDIKAQAAIDKASGGGRSSRAPGLHEMTPEMAALADELYGVNRKRTDRSKFETTSKEGDPLSRMSPEQEAAAIESGGDVGDALSRKLGGIVSTAMDEKGYAAAEGDRTERNLRTTIALTSPGSLDNLSKSKTDDLVRQVTEFAIKNPKASVGELADRLGLLKPGDKRIAADKSGRLYNEATGEITQEAPDDASTSVSNMVKSIDAQRKAIENKAANLRAAKAAELKDASPSERKRIIEKYDAQIKELDTRHRQLEEKFDVLDERVGIKKKPTSATTTPMPSSAAPGVRSVIQAIKSKQSQ